jgi:LPS-assembly lipoprotein
MSWSERRHVLAALAGLALASCGFHLRGEATYAFGSLYLNSPPGDPFTAELRRAIEGAAHMQLAATPAAAQVVLDVTGLIDDKQVLSLSGGGRVREYLLNKRVVIALHDATGRDWLPAAEVQVRRSYTFHAAEALAREAQDQRHLKELQSDIVQQIVRRLHAARAPA